MTVLLMALPQIEREEKADREPETTTASAGQAESTLSPKARMSKDGRSRSRRRTVTDAGQAPAANDDEVDENTSAAELLERRGAHPDPNLLSPSMRPATQKAGQANGTSLIPDSGRPRQGGVAFPFKLASRGNDEVNASTVTLTSAKGVLSPTFASKGEQSKEETSKAETPKSETPKAETPKAETPNVETPKAETPKPEKPNAETPKPDAPKAETLNTE